MRQRQRLQPSRNHPRAPSSMLPRRRCLASTLQKRCCLATRRLLWHRPQCPQHCP